MIFSNLNNFGRRFNSQNILLVNASSGRDKTNERRSTSTRRPWLYLLRWNHESNNDKETQRCFYGGPTFSCCIPLYEWRTRDKKLLYYRANAQFTKLVCNLLTSWTTNCRAWAYFLYGNCTSIPMCILQSGVDRVSASVLAFLEKYRHSCSKHLLLFQSFKKRIKI